MRVSIIYMTVFAGLLTLLTSCSQNTAVDYNDFIVSEFNQTNRVLEESEELYLTKDNDSIVIAYNNCKQSVQHLIDTINSVKVPEGAGHFHEAALNLATYYRDHVLVPMKEIVELTELPDKKSFLVIMSLLNESYEGQDSVVSLFTAAQNEYAAANGIVVMPEAPASE